MEDGASASESDSLCCEETSSEAADAAADQEPEAQTHLATVVRVWETLFGLWYPDNAPSSSSSPSPASSLDGP